MLVALVVFFRLSGGQALTASVGAEAAVAALQPQTLILQDGVSPPGYAGTADAFIDFFLPEKQGGLVDPDVLRVKAGHYHTLLRFDLSPLPPGAEVLSAVLSLYSYDADNSTSMVVEAYQVLRPWVDVEARWNGPRTGETWDVPGCAGAGTDRAATPCAAQTLAVHGRWYDFDVASVVSLWASGAADNYGLVLVPVSGANHHRFRSADAGWEQYRLVRPKLAITYLPSGQTPTVTTTPTASATHTPTSEVTGTATRTPSPPGTPDNRRTPIPDSLYPYPEQRVGFVAFRSNFDFSRLGAGFVKLENRGPTAHERSLAPDFCTVILEDTQTWELPDPATYWGRIEQMVADNPGHLWFIGNEPENPCRFGSHSGEYVQRYHKLYTFIKALDATAQVGIGGVVLPSQIRRAWLENVLTAYQNRYGQPMPIDVWNVHNLLLSECPGPCRPTDPNPCDPSLRCSGGYVPQELWCQKGLYYSQADQARVDEFTRLLVEFRQWMKDQGFQDKPLIVTEMGVLAQTTEGSCPGCYSHVDINQFMYETFQYMMETKDPNIGYPLDGYRLVQRWTWYALAPTLNFNGYLFDEQSIITDFGLNFANYTARFLPSAPTTIFFQRGWTGYIENGDTTLSEFQTGDTWSIKDTLHISADGAKKALLKFDLSVLPSNVEVISATLSLRSATHQNVGNMTVRGYGVKRAWDVNQASWTNATQGTAWEMPGCSGPSDREMVPAASVLVTADNTTYTWDVTRLARQWVANPSANYGMLLEGEAAGSGYWAFRSSEVPEQPPYWLHRYRPKLELLVELPEPTPTPTLTASPTATATDTATPTITPSITPTPSATHTPGLVDTLTPTPTSTATGTRLPTPTGTLTPTQTGTASHKIYLPVLTKSVRMYARPLQSLSDKPSGYAWGHTWPMGGAY
jgi:hypothetical protein